MLTFELRGCVIQGYRYTYVVKETVSLKGHSQRLTPYESDLSFFNYVAKKNSIGTSLAL